MPRKFPVEVICNGTALSTDIHLFVAQKLESKGPDAFQYVGGVSTLGTPRRTPQYVPTVPDSWMETEISHR